MIKDPTAVRWDTFSLSQEFSRLQISLFIFHFVSLVVLCHHQNVASLSPSLVPMWCCWYVRSNFTAAFDIIHSLCVSAPPHSLSLLPLWLCLLSPSLSTGIVLMGFYRKRALMELWPSSHHIYKALHACSCLSWCSLAQNCNSALTLRLKRRKSNPTFHTNLPNSSPSVKSPSVEVLLETCETSGLSTPIIWLIALSNTRVRPVGVPAHLSHTL